MTMREQRVTDTFVELADTLVAGFDTVEFLHTLTERCVELLDAETAGLLLADERGSLRLVAASTSETQLLELFQLQEEEGPCLECYRTGQVVTLPDASQVAGRWPRFTAMATELGFAGVHAIPMQLRTQVIGTLNLFRTHPNGLDDNDARLGKALVDVATIGLLSERAVRHQEMVTEQLQTALNSRVTIEQAKGVLAERHGVTTDQAFTAMRRHARSQSRRLGEVAGEIIVGEVDITVTDTANQRHVRP
ncbi:GAF and ANTAR domain-containing protein [Prauserella aidingensis]|uniref:GAF and ANTAR domain-containing protein n=1 Tax=Prauserella aidingensis TaxID=387890 RepID=UPI0020A5B84F|nr:GAF and ANTAR domain-containing protein [Prauserella aidingensis]